jgi:DNA-binding SARP family transcriptional activator
MAMSVTTRPRSMNGSSLRLLSEFQLLVDGRPISLPHSGERVLAFLGISQAPVSRARLAGSLWPDVADQRAHGDLRSALWRLRRIAGVIDEEPPTRARTGGSTSTSPR